MSNFHNLLTNARAQITEVDADDILARPDAFEVFLDVREPSEVDLGAIPGSIHLPRGNLELQVEGVLPNKNTPVLVYCAAGIRSAFAALTLRELGYTKVASLRGGFDAWKAHGGNWEIPFRLTDTQRLRYHRHLLLPGVGEAGQLRLLTARVLILGAGGLGSPGALYLAAAGVGTIGIVDMDEVDVSNLQRQIIHSTATIGQRKVDSAKAAIAALNPDVRVHTYDYHLNATNIDAVLTDYDVVIDGTDNFATRYIINDAASTIGIPVVHGSIYQFEGQVTVFAPPRGPCFRCFAPVPPPVELAPSCAQAGVLGVLPGIIGTLQATEAIKIILGIGEPLIGRILTYDATTEEFQIYRLTIDPKCAAVGHRAKAERAEARGLADTAIDVAPRRAHQNS